MAPRYRSRRARLAALSAQLRAGGQSWAQIARTVQDQEHVNARVALRLAHGWTQEQVAIRWNQQWPPKGGSAGITDKNISAWETWPLSGVQPSLKTLKRLAQLYQCDIGQLVEDGDYRHLDEVNHQGDYEADRPVALRDSRPPDTQIEATATAMLGAQCGDRVDGTLAPLEVLTLWSTERPEEELLGELADRSQEFGEWGRRDRGVRCGDQALQGPGQVPGQGF
jgi:transcriptional regulator with XRE-family HTH domain